MVSERWPSSASFRSRCPVNLSPNGRNGSLLRLAESRVAEYLLLAFLDNRLALGRPELESGLWKPEE